MAIFTISKNKNKEFYVKFCVFNEISCAKTLKNDRICKKTTYGLDDAPW